MTFTATSGGLVQTSSGAPAPILYESDPALASGITLNPASVIGFAGGISPMAGTTAEVFSSADTLPLFLPRIARH